jgi:hypothetical protein
VREKDAGFLEEIMKGEDCAQIGETTNDQRLVFDDEQRRTVATASVAEIRAAWTQGLSRFLD